MKTQDDIRAFILKKSQECSDSKGALAEWSRAMGRNHAYLHQFINRGSPRKLDEDDRAKLAEAMGIPEADLMTSPGATVDKSAAAQKFIKTRIFKFYVAEWREFMGVKIGPAAKAAGLDPDEYEAHEVYPINFTLGQIAALAVEFGIRGDQFWFPPPKGKHAPIAPTTTSKKRARK